MNKDTNNSERLDIVKLINNSPLTNISKGFQSTLIEKIQKSFTDDEQQIFVASFYSYLNYNSKTDFVIDLDYVWKWCGFTRRDNSKRILDKHFTENVDYKKLLLKLEEQVTETTQNANTNKNLGGAGLNKETILMTVNTFKKFCLKAGTKRADEIQAAIAYNNYITELNKTSKRQYRLNTIS
jgi:hypothetical protein